MDVTQRADRDARHGCVAWRPAGRAASRCWSDRPRRWRRSRRRRPRRRTGSCRSTSSQPQEQLPAAPLVIAAYAVAWLVIFGYVWSLWRGSSSVEREIADVSRRIDAGRPPVNSAT